MYIVLNYFALSAESLSTELDFRTWKSQVKLRAKGATVVLPTLSSRELSCKESVLGLGHN